MVKREQWGDLREILEKYSNDELYELCYLLEQHVSGRKDEKINRVLKSKFSKEYVLETLNRLEFYLSFETFFYKDELSEILRDYGLPISGTRWEKIINILESEAISPRELIGMLKTSKIEDYFRKTYGKEPTGERNSLIDKILRDRNFEKTSKTGFIMMAMNEDPFLKKTYQIIKDECRNFDINIERIDELQSSELITKDIIKKIKSAEFLFVELTGERPNVYYELGFCHGRKKNRKKIVLIAKKGTKRHFDIYGMRTIIYENHDELREKLDHRLKVITN